MREGSFFERFYTAGDWLFRLIALQLLFLFSVIVTLGVFGLFPGLAASFATTRQWLLGKNNSIVKTYVQYMKSYFWVANLFGYILTITTVSIGFYIYWFQQMDGIIPNVLLFISFFLAIFLVILWVFLFPILVHFDVSKVEVFKFAIIIGLGRPLHLIGVLLLFGGMFLWASFLPVFIFILDISLLFLIWMAITRNAFKKYS